MVIQSHKFYPPTAGYQQHGYAMYQDDTWAEETAMGWGMPTKPLNPCFSAPPTSTTNKMVYDGGHAQPQPQPQPQPQDGWQRGMKKPQEGWNPTHDNHSGGKYEGMKGNPGPKVYRDTYAPMPAARVEEVVCYNGSPGYEFSRWPAFGQPNPYQQFGPPRAEWVSRGV